MPRQTSSLVNDRLVSLVASGRGYAVRGPGERAGEGSAGEGSAGEGSAGGGSAGGGSARDGSVGESGADESAVARLERGWVPVDPGSIELPEEEVEVTSDEGDALGEEEDPPVRPRRAPAEAQPGRHRDPRGRRGPGVVTLPVSLRGSQVDVSWHGIVALVVVLVVAGLVFAVRVARAEGAASPTPVAGATSWGVVRSTTPSAFLTAGASASAPGPGGATTSAAVIVVHVAGQVARPGVVTLSAGSRIVDALAKAGGPLPGADVARLNLAQLLADGEQVYVPRPGEDPPVPIGGSGGSAVGSAGSGGGGTGSGGSGGGTSPVVVDLNVADLAGLDGLPGVGPVLAQRILDWRGQHGRFRAVDELGEVSGIGDKLLEQLRPHVRI